MSSPTSAGTGPLFPEAHLPSGSDLQESVRRWSETLWKVVDVLESAVLDMEGGADQPEYSEMLRWIFLEKLCQTELVLAGTPDVEFYHWGALAAEHGLGRIARASPQELFERLDIFPRGEEGTGAPDPAAADPTASWRKVEAFWQELRRRFPGSLPGQREEDSNLEIMRVFELWGEAYETVGLAPQVLEAVIEGMIDDVPSR